jgi:hypothetical protein
LTVRYLAAQPPLDPVRAGSSATVYVDSRHRPYTWSLARVGASRQLGHGAADNASLRVRVPKGRAGLYVLSLRAGSYLTQVPLIAREARAERSRAGVLVVLPALSWQGQNPVDDDGDGLPNTLDGGDRVALGRPFARGLPPGFSDEAALIAYLDQARLSYDLTSDLGLIDGVTPGLAGHKAVLLAGAERWVSPGLASSLRSYVESGGTALVLGIDSLRRQVVVRAGSALEPSAPARTDMLLAQPGSLVAHNRQLLLVLRDGLGIFSSTSGAFPGHNLFEPIGSVVPPAQGIESAAGTSAAAVAIAGYRLARGAVVRIGLGDFGRSLTHGISAQELIHRLWRGM